MMDPNETGSSNVIPFTRRRLFIIMQLNNNVDNFNEKLDYLENHLLNLENFSEELVKEIKHKFSMFKSQLKERWAKAKRIESRFLSTNAEWLDSVFSIPEMTTRQGRPTKTFGESSLRTKRRKTEELRRNTELDALTYATQLKFMESVKRDASTILKTLTETLKWANKYKKGIWF